MSKLQHKFKICYTIVGSYIILLTFITLYFLKNNEKF